MSGQSIVPQNRRINKYVSGTVFNFLETITNISLGEGAVLLRAPDN